MQQLNRKNALILAGVVVLGLILVKVLSGPKPNKQAQEYHFHPDSVLSLTWLIGDKKFSFTRPQRSVPWSPAVDTSNLQKKLIALGTAELKDMKAPSEGEVIEVGFGENNQWTGVYANRKFVWTSGLKQGQGFETDANWARVFEEGRFSFDPHKWNWCMSRPVKIEMHTDRIDTEVYQKNHAWFLKNKGRESKLDATAVEKWLGRFCEIEVGFFRDLKFFPPSLGLSKDRFKVEFEKGDKLDISRKDDFWLVDSEKGVESPKLFAALEELISLPHQ